MKEVQSHLVRPSRHFRLSAIEVDKGDESPTFKLAYRTRYRREQSILTLTVYTNMNANYDREGAGEQNNDI